MISWDIQQLSSKGAVIMVIQSSIRFHGEFTAAELLDFLLGPSTNMGTYAND
jgi:hypothetical protein